MELPADAAHQVSELLTGAYAVSGKDKKNISVVTTGSGALHTLVGILNFFFYDPRRKAVRLKQAGRGGTGTVFRDKGLRALVVRFSGLDGRNNRPADFRKLVAAGQRIKREIRELDTSQNRMRQVGTASLLTVMNDYDLLPVHNFSMAPTLKAARSPPKCYPATPDGVPIIDYAPGLECLVLAVGMCGQGFMLGPGVADYITSLILGGKPAIPEEAQACF